ncbi:hypothetical protein TWF694_010047 [Orbilia ellipsospora]|uniref:Uncharacterized protein n=1 Tax=Orbilia ellipsospora TaxID=2528407 RepID=A0AAV9X8Q1_9PEZI
MASLSVPSKSHPQSRHKSTGANPLHQQLEQALKASRAGSSNSGVNPIYEPGEEPKRWQPETPIVPLNDKFPTGSRFPKKKLSRNYDLMLSVSSSAYLNSESDSDGKSSPDREFIIHDSVRTTAPDMKKKKNQSSGAVSSQATAAKLKREERAEYYRSIGTGPDLSKTKQTEMKNTKVYNRLAGCDVTIYHPGRKAKKEFTSTVSEGLNLRIAISQHNLKILAVLHSEDGLTGATGFYNLASLNWHISSLPESSIRCYIDKMEDRHLAKTGRWQFKPTYFFEVKNQGKLEYGYSGQAKSAAITQAQVEEGQKCITEIRNSILNCLTQQKRTGFPQPVAWLAIHSLSPQTDGDDALTQIAATGTKFQFTSWNAVPMLLLQEKLMRSLKTLQDPAHEKKGCKHSDSEMISTETKEQYQKALDDAKAQATIGIPLENFEIRPRFPILGAPSKVTASRPPKASASDVSTSSDIASTYADELSSNEDSGAIQTFVQPIPPQSPGAVSEASPRPESPRKHIARIQGVQTSILENGHQIQNLHIKDLNKGVEQNIGPRQMEDRKPGKVGKYLHPTSADASFDSCSDSGVSEADPKQPNESAFLGSGQPNQKEQPAVTKEKPPTNSPNSGVSMGKHFKMSEEALNRVLAPKRAKRQEMAAQQMRLQSSRYATAKLSTSLNSYESSNESDAGGVSLPLYDLSENIKQIIAQRKKKLKVGSSAGYSSDGGVAVSSVSPSVASYWDVEIDRAIELASLSEDVNVSGESSALSPRGGPVFGEDIESLKKKFGIRAEKGKEDHKPTEFW